MQDIRDKATWEPVATDGEYVVICPCGYSDYYAADCSCERCQSTTHPVPACPQCGRVVVSI